MTNDVIKRTGTTPGGTVNNFPWWLRKPTDVYLLVPLNGLIHETKLGNAEKEREILASVASYGKQLGASTMP